MWTVNHDFEKQAVSCLFDLFADSTRWFRRLWTVSIPLAIHELLEASQAQHASILGASTVGNLAQEISILASRDWGVGDKARRRELQGHLKLCLKDGLRPDGHCFHALRLLHENIRNSYLPAWESALRNPDLHSELQARPVDIARALAAAMLDHGFSSTHLHRWLTALETDADSYSLADLFGLAHTKLTAESRVFEVAIPLNKGADRQLPEPFCARRPFVDWLRSKNFNAENRRHNGGFIVQVHAKDIFAAIDQAADLLEQAFARIAVNERIHLSAHDYALVTGDTEQYEHRRFRRVRVRREPDAVSSGQRERDRIDLAVEMLAASISGTASQAASSAWTAVESLLAGPGDDKSVAASRIATILACSYPRAIMTALSYEHIKANSDALALQLHELPSNREKATLLAEALRRDSVVIPNGRAQYLYLRAQRMVKNPASELRQLASEAECSLRRLYRQRNLIVHWAKTDGVAMKASLRTALPLISEGVERITHAWVVRQVPPLALAAQADLGVQLAESGEGRPLFSLLDS